MPAEPTSVSKFNRDTQCTVRVVGMSAGVSRQEVVSLFSAFIGTIKTCEECLGDSSGRYLELTFYTPDDTKKALCMTGYTVSGNPLLVTFVTPSGDDRRVPSQSKKADMRRNLYVLNLPCGFTKPEFVELFSRYGTVSHCVILATADNASRRRGFVVMSKHEEAKLAMKILSRTEVKGYTIDVSWAVVQRSQGFLDGGDRNIDVQPTSALPLTGIEHDSIDFSFANTCELSSVSSEQDPAYSSAIPATSSTLLVTNLPYMLFSQTEDLYPLFCPFGTIKRLEILDESTDVHACKTSAIIEYFTASAARDANQTLQGQCYANFAINVDYVQTPFQVTQSRLNGRTSRAQSNMSPLNPFAPPFVMQAHSSPSFTTPAFTPLNYHSYKNPNCNYTRVALPSGLLADAPYPSASLPYPGSNGNYGLMTSRSSSTNSRLSNDSNQQLSTRLPYTTPSLHLNCYDA